MHFVYLRFGIDHSVERVSNSMLDFPIFYLPKLMGTIVYHIIIKFETPMDSATSQINTQQESVSASY